MPHEFKLKEFTPYRTNQLSAEMSRAFTEVFLAPFNLTIPEWRVLGELSQRQDLSIRDLNTVQLDKATVTRAVQLLERSGLVLRAAQPDDRRLIALRLTPKGHELVDRLIPKALAFEAEIRVALGPADMRAFDRIIRSLHECLARIRHEAAD